MTDIEKRALELWGPGIAAEVNLHNFAILGSAFIEMRDRHEAFKQEVSDAVEAYLNPNNRIYSHTLNQFIIPAPKPDPLVGVLCGAIATMGSGDFVTHATLAAALEARGLEIRSKADD
jgi:hypothetical protein